MKKATFAVNRALSILLVLCMLLTFLPATAKAADIVASGTCGANGDNLTWTLDSDGVLIISGSGAMANYNEDGYNRGPFRSDSSINASIKSIVFTNGVTSIGSCSFCLCQNLSSVSIPDSVTVIGYKSFMNCRKLSDVQLPESITTIYGYAFSQCGMTNVRIPENVTYIGEGAFAWCPLKRVFIPSSVNYIDVVPFRGCSELTSIEVDPNNNQYSSQDGVLFNKNMTLLRVCPEGKQGIYSIPNSVKIIEGSAFSNSSLSLIIIPNSVKEIGNSAFRDNSTIMNILIPRSVSSIGSWAFVTCNNLTSVTIPNSITSIEEGTFAECGWTDIIIPDSVTSIGKWAFANCKKLINLYISKSVTQIREAAFENCSSLTDVYYYGSEADWKAISKESRNDPLSSATIHYNWNEQNEPDDPATYPFDWKDDVSPIDSVLGNDNLVLTVTALAKLAYNTFNASEHLKTPDPDIVGDTFHPWVVNEYISAGIIGDANNKIWNTDKFEKAPTAGDFYNSVVGNYEVVEDLDLENNVGFYGVCFREPGENGKYIISYRGSGGPSVASLLHLVNSEEGLNDDWATDLDFALRNKLSKQFDYALGFYQAVVNGFNLNKDDVVLTGHSLGGALAAYVSICTGARAYSIDGAAGHIVDTTFWQAYFDAHGFTGANDFNFVNLTDQTGYIADVLSEQTGSLIELIDRFEAPQLAYACSKGQAAEFIQAAKQGKYPMVTYNSTYPTNCTDIKDMIGVHSVFSNIEYDESTRRFSMGEMAQIFDWTNPSSGWSMEIRDDKHVAYGYLADKIAEKLTGINVHAYQNFFHIFARGRVSLGTTAANQITSVSDWNPLDIEALVGNNIFGGDGSDTLIGYSGSDTLVPYGSGSTLDGGNGADFYIIDSTIYNTTIHDSSGQDIVFLRNWSKDVSVSRTNDYIIVQDSSNPDRTINVDCVNRDNSAANSMSICWIDSRYNTNKEYDCDVLYRNIFDEAESVTNRGAVLMQSRGETLGSDDERSSRMVRLNGIAEVDIYDETGNKLNDVPFSNTTAGICIERRSFAYYYGFNSENDSFATIYLINDGYSVKVRSQNTSTLQLYQYDDENGSIVGGMSTEDISLNENDELNVISAGQDKGFYYTKESNPPSALSNVVSFEYAQSLELSESAITLDRGDSTTLTALPSPVDAIIDGAWISSDPSVASVDNGIVTAKRGGEAEISFTTINGKTASCVVTVPKKTIIVSFDANGGSGNMETVFVTEGEFMLPENGFVSTGNKAFSGWEIDSVQYAPGDIVQLTKDAVITARWDAVRTFTISFEANGGAGTMDDVTEISGNYTLPNCSFTAPAGKTFKEWSVEIGDAEPVTKAPNDAISVTADTTVTAVWADKEIVATPMFSPTGGTFTETQSVTLSCATGGATIHYTADGSAPTVDSPVYSTAITVSTTTTIKAIAVKADMTESLVAEATYTITEIPTTYAVIVNNGTGSSDYAEGASVMITANAPASGKRFKEWIGEDGLIFTSGSATTAEATFTMPANAVTVEATYEDIPATAPNITMQPTNLELQYGYIADNMLTVAASAANDHTVTGYQWYSCDDASRTNAQEISGATNASYTIPVGKSAGTTECYYCIITAARTDNSQTATSISDVATVTVSKAANPATVTGTVSVTRGGNSVDLSAKVALNGAAGAVSYEISGEANGCTLNGSVLTSGTDMGSVTVNVTIAEDGNYEALAATAITVTITDKATQTISFASATQTKTYGDADFTMTATGAQTSVSYQITSGDAATVDSATAVVHIVKAGTAIITATAAETDTYASAAASYTLTVDPKSVTIPTAATGLKWTGSEQTGVAAGTDYTVSNGKATNVGNYTATATLTDTTNYKWSDNTTAAKSIPWSIDKANGPAAPTGIAGVAPTSSANNDGKITGVDTTMEYSANGTTYTVCGGTTISGLATGTYYVRVAATTTHEAGATVTVSVSAYTPPTVYSVTVTDDGHGTGSASLASGVSGTEVTLTASPTSGYRFKEWQVVSGGVTVTNNKFTIGTANVTVKATFEQITYSVSGSFDANGKLVATVTAPKDSVLIAAAYESNGRMADTKSFAVTAAMNGGTHPFTDLKTGTGYTYKLILVDKTSYAPLCAAWGNTKLTVSNGTGSGEYAAEATVTITANAAPAGQVFYMWTSDSAIFASAYSATTTITMPTKNTTVTATYKSTVNPTPSGGSSGGSSGGGSTPTTPSSTTNADGGTTRTTTNADGSKTELTTARDGSTTTTTTAKDGSAVTTEKTADGSTGTVKTDAQGNTVSAEAAPSAKAISDAAAKGEAVTLPVEVRATNDAASAASVTITLPAGSDSVTVEIPVENLTAGTVAVIVNPDGTEEIVKTSTTGEDGVVLTLDSSATVKIVDNTKSFDDMTGNEWYADNVAWAASHEIMNGVGDGDFAPNAVASRAQIAQLLFNLDGATADGNLADFLDVSAEDWYADAVTWMVENGIAGGMGESFGAKADVTREQLAVMLYNYARCKGYETSASGSLSAFPDVGGVSGYAQTALAWAVGVGLINGTTDENGNVVLDPQGSATRAQISAITQRFCEKVAK